jgi:hypothetical protein
MRIRREWEVVSEVRDRIDIFATSTSGCWLDPGDNVNAATNADGLGKGAGGKGRLGEGV